VRPQSKSISTGTFRFASLRNEILNFKKKKKKIISFGLLLLEVIELTQFLVILKVVIFCYEQYIKEFRYLSFEAKRFGFAFQSEIQFASFMSRCGFHSP